MGAGTQGKPQTIGQASAWHARSIAEIEALLVTDATHGLTEAEALARRARQGGNVLPRPLRRTPVRLLLAQFADGMVLVLLGAAVVAALVGNPEDLAAILAIVLLNALLGFIQEYRAERALAALSALAVPHARVKRAGGECTVDAESLVPGDVVLLEAGQAVPADVRLNAVHRLRIEEAALTGESEPVEKAALPAMAAELPVGDRRGMAFRGTLVTAGRASGIVVATGRQTELGRIATMLNETDEVRTPLQRRVAGLGRTLSLLVLIACAGMLVAGLRRGEPLPIMIMTALSLAVAAIPEALPAVITVSLALGARRLAQHRALIRRLPAVETLGAVTCICTDKTGTLTENRMRVAVIRLPEGGELPEAALTHPTANPSGSPLSLADALALCSDVHVAADGALTGDPTETALVDAAVSAGLEVHGVRARWPRVAEHPFTPERARMTTVHQHREDRTAFSITKGAPEQVIPRCATMMSTSGGVPIDAPGVMAQVHTMAAEGLRVLAIAVGTLPGGWVPSGLSTEVSDPSETALELRALIGLADPPRPDARDAVRTCQGAGIRVVMITGDHPETARAIAETLGICDPDATVLTGRELTALDDAALAARVLDVGVYARVAPEDKLRIVQALQARGEYVAMTGDGINDAPALRRANIGVAMGRSGTDVAREAAHMVLLDDRFSTIVHAVQEGRRIYDNIRRFVRFVLATNAGELWTLLLAPLVGLPLPLLPIHILWMNLVTDGLPGLALTAEPADPAVMHRPPRPPDEGLLGQGLWQHVLWVGLLMALLALGTQAWALRTGRDQAQTMVFLVLTLSTLAHGLAIRSETIPLWRLGWRSNPWLLSAVAVTGGLQLFTVYLPSWQRVFRTRPLTVGEFTTCVALATLVFAAVEGEKNLRRRWARRAAPAAAHPYRK